MADSYDLVIIGSGTAAQDVSTTVREAGWTVAVIDALPFGGTRQSRGWDPKKVPVSAEEAVDAVRRTRPRGITEDVGIDWAALMAFKRSFTHEVPPPRVAFIGGGYIASELSHLAARAGAVRVEQGRLVLDEFLRGVSSPRVFATGDAASAGPPLTPVASLDAKVVAANRLKGARRRPDYPTAGAGVASMV